MVANLLKILVAFVLVIGFNAQAQEMGFEEYNPTSTLVVPKHELSQSKFPFIDVHSHQRNMDSRDLSELISLMDGLNEGIMVNLSGGNGDRITNAVKHINETYPNRFVVFANIDFSEIGTPGWTEKAVKQLEADVQHGAKGLKIYKSLGLRHKDTDGNRVAIDDERIGAIWEKCGELGIPVLIHAADPKPFWDEFDADNERWLELKTHQRRKRSATDPVPWEQIIEEQHNMFKKHPNTNFINAHMGWYANDLDTLSALLDEIPNMNVGIAAVIAELGRQPKRAHAFFVKYQDRVLFGKDSWKPEEFPTYFRVLETNDEYFPYYKKYHAFWSMYGLGLPDIVLKKLYYGNALRLIPGLDKSLFPEVE